VQGLANFLDDVMGGFVLVGLSVVIGGLAWALAVLRGWSAGAGLVQRCLLVVTAGAAGLGLAQALKLATKAVVIASSLGELPLAEYASTAQFRAGAARIVLAAALALSARHLARHPQWRAGWGVLVGIAAVILVCGAWLVHGAARLDDRALLMTLTVAHQLAAGVWVGGVVQLLFLWPLRRRDAAAEDFWPIALTRFSALGIAAVGGLLATGIALTAQYVGSWEGLVGTAYGSLVLSKVCLLVVTLGFAYLNFSAGRAWLRDRRSRVADKVSYHVEAETFLLVSLLFLAATVSSQPPAIDIPNLTASVDEVKAMFAPRLPQVRSPAHRQLLEEEAGRFAVVGPVASPAAADWSDYNHNVSGLFLVAMGLVGLLSYVRGFQWARYWPLGFVGLSIFLFFRSDADTWPLGPAGFWESTLGDSEVLQHRTATLLAFALGALETRARTARRSFSQLRYLFPLLCAFGGVLLITHSHTAFEIKRDYLIQSTHLAMGILAVLMATGRWLELRYAHTGRSHANLAGMLAIGAMLAIGLLLMFYREPSG